jgi:hypothetical protein
MPPLYDESDSNSPTSSMIQLFNNILSSSIAMCNDNNVIGTSNLCNNIKGEGEDYQPSTTTNKETISTAAAIKKLEIVRARRKASLLSSSGTTTASSNDPRRPPLNPKTKSKKSYRNRRKKVGLSVDTSLTSSDGHSIPKAERQDAPPLISCSRNIELRRKSLGEQHFFRPVSFEEDSVGAKQ